MTDPVLDASTVRQPARRRPRGPVVCPTLTVASHPDVERIGEVAALLDVLAGSAVEVSRRGPEFAPVRGGAGRPLADPFVSRRPFTIAADRDGARLICPLEGSRVVADGVPVAGELALSGEALERGVVLGVAERVVLLLHRAPLGAELPAACGLVGESAALQELRRDIVRVWDLDVSVLVRGETGAGKELVARAVHDHGPRAGGPFVATNMATVAATLAASELFGHVRGAFSGATHDRAGLFARADGGTLFMDEVGDTPPEVQAMLLRVLETGEVTPVGGSRARQVDVRLVAATDAALEAGADDGSFRAQLLHRLSGYELRVPPLRARRDDIPRLFLHFLREALARVDMADRLRLADPYAEPWLPASLLPRLLAHPWPGNVRELAAAAGKIAIASRGGAFRMPPGVLEDEGAAPPPALDPQEVPVSRPRYRKPHEVGEDELVAALRASGWGMTEAARALNVSRTTLYALVDACAAVRKASELSDAELAMAWQACGGDAKRMAARLEVSPRGLRLRLRDFEPSRR